MKPIDKFEWKENRSDELSALEYCKIISSLYITQDEYQIRHFEISESTTADMNKALVPISEAVEIFVSRYNNRELTHIFTYEINIKNGRICCINVDKPAPVKPDSTWRKGRKKFPPDARETYIYRIFASQLKNRLYR